MQAGVWWIGGDFLGLPIPCEVLEIPGATEDDAPGYDREAGPVVFVILIEDHLCQELNRPTSLGGQHCAPCDLAQKRAVGGEAGIDHVVKHHEAAPSQGG